MLKLKCLLELFNTTCWLFNYSYYYESITIDCYNISDIADLRTDNKNTITDGKQENRSKHEEIVDIETFIVDLEKEYEENSIAKHSLTSQFDNKQEFEHITRSNHNRTIEDEANSQQPITTETLQMTDQRPNLDRPVEWKHHQDDKDQQEQEGKPLQNYITIGITIFTLHTFDFCQWSKCASNMTQSSFR